MFSKKGKKLTAFLLALVMVFGVVPALDFGQGAEITEAKITPDKAGGTYTELTFSDFFGSSEVTVTGEEKPGISDAITAESGWGGIAVSGFVTWPSYTSDNYIDIGYAAGSKPGFRLVANQDNNGQGWHMWNSNSGGWIGGSLTSGSSVANNTTLLRLEFDVVGADLQIKCYVNRQLCGTRTYTGGFNYTLAGQIRVGAAAGESVVLTSYNEYNPASDYTHLSFWHFNKGSNAFTTAEGAATGSGDASASMSGDHDYAAATRLHRVAFEGYVTYPKDAESIDTVTNTLHFGKLVAFRMMGGDRTRMCAFNPITGANYDQWDCPASSTILEGKEILLQVRFDIIEQKDYKLTVFIDGDPYGEFIIEDGVEQTWGYYSVSLAAAANNTVKYRHREGKCNAVEMKEFTFRDFDSDGDIGQVGDYLENGNSGDVNNTEPYSGGGHYHDYIQEKGFHAVSVTGYVKWDWEGDTPTVLGNKLQFGNLFHYSPLNKNTIILAQPKEDLGTNEEFARYDVSGVANLQGHYVKIRTEMIYEESFYAIRTYINDEFMGTTRTEGNMKAEYNPTEDPQDSTVLWYRAIVMGSAANKNGKKESISWISDCDEYTFSDFGIEDQIFTGNTNGYVGGPNATLDAKKSYDNMAFTGYVKFPAKYSAAVSLQFGELTRVYLKSATELAFDTCNEPTEGSYSWVNQQVVTAKNSDGTEKTLENRWIQLRIEFDLAEDGTKYYARVYMDGTLAGTLTLQPNISLLSYFSTLVYVSDASAGGIGIKSFPSYDEGITPELTNTDFDIADGTYSSATGKAFDKYTSKTISTLNRKKFSANVTLNGTSAIYVGATSATSTTTGIKVAATSSGVTVAPATAISGVSAVTIPGTTAGTEFTLSLGMELIDAGNDGKENDLQVTVYSEDAEQVICFTDYTDSFGNYLSIAPSSSVVFNEYKRTIDSSYDRRSLADVAMSGNTLEDGMIPSGTALSGHFADDVNHVVYGSLIKPASDSYYWSMRYATDGKNNGNVAYGMRIGIETPSSSNHTTDAVLYLDYQCTSDMTKGFDKVWQWDLNNDDNFQSFQDENKLEVTTDYVDADVDGLVDDVMLGIWLNGELTDNAYIYLIDYIDYIGKGVNYAGETQGFQIFQLMEKDLFDETYELNLEPNGYQVPEFETVAGRGYQVSQYEQVTIKNTYDGTKGDNPVTNYTKAQNETYKTIGSHETTIKSHGTTYKRNITITMLSDANMNSVFNIGDLVRMKKLANNKVDYSTQDKILMANADMGAWDKKIGDKSAATGDGQITETDTKVIRDLLLERYRARDILEVRDPKMRSGVMSDMHLRENEANDIQRQYNYREALEYYKDQRVSSIVMNGDISDYGDEQSYNKLIDIFNQVYYKEYTYKDFGFSDQGGQVHNPSTSDFESGDNEQINTTKSLDRVAIQGYVTWDETAANGGGGVRVGKILALRPETDKSVRIGTDIFKDGEVSRETKIGVIDLGYDYKGEKIKFRFEFDIDGKTNNYWVKIYFDDVYGGAFLLDPSKGKMYNGINNSVDLFKIDTNLYCMSYTNEYSDYASTDAKDNQRPRLLATADNHEYYDAWWFDGKFSISHTDYEKADAAKKETYKYYDTVSNRHYTHPAYFPGGDNSKLLLDQVKTRFYENMEEWGVELGGATSDSINVSFNWTVDATSGTTTQAYPTKHKDALMSNLKTGSTDAYHFISVNEDYLKGGLAGYTVGTLNWLVNVAIKQAVDADPTKPVFVFVHPPMLNTTVTSEYEGDGNDAIAKTMRESTVINSSYMDNVIFFGGHTHSPITDEKSIWQGDFTAVNTASTYYASVKEYSKDDAKYTENSTYVYADSGKDIYKYSQGLLLEIEGSKTTIKRIDFWNTESAGKDWTVDTSAGAAGFQYTDAAQTATSKEAPSAFENHDLEIEHTSKTSVNLLFDPAKAATNGNSVHRYIVTVKEGNDVVKTLNFRSYRYLGTENMPKKLILPVTGLEEGVKYNFLVEAEDTWGTRSKPIVESMYCYHY